MDNIVLLSSFYSFEPFVASAHTFSPNKIILIIAEETISKIEDNIAKVKSMYGTVASVEVVKVKGADLLGIAEKTIELLEKEDGKKIVNVSGGWKLLALGVMYGCYARPELVSKIVCNNIQDNSVVELPRLNLEPSASKMKILHEVSKKEGRNIASIAKKLGVTRGMVYQHLKELKELGYIDEEFEITLAGRMALM